MRRSVERFEDLIAWQKARALTIAIYRATQDGRFARDYGLANQMQRAAVSMMSNIAEGFERGRRAEFLQFLSIAKASRGEVRSQLYVALDVGYFDQSTFNTLIASADEAIRVISGLRSSVKRLTRPSLHE